MGKIEKNSKKFVLQQFKNSPEYFTTLQRSKNMSKIKGKNTKAELLLRRALWRLEIRYRLHVKHLPGRPDIVIRRFRLAIFVDGGFWHGYNWKRNKNRLKTNREFWIAKIENNMIRDRKNQELLESAGYTVMRFWDHEIKSGLEKCVNQILLFIEANAHYPIPLNSLD